MNELIQINNDGLTGRFCNPHNKETNYSTWFRFEQNISSFPVITDTPLVPGSVHKANLIKQINIGGGWGNRQAGDTKKYPYERQAYQLIEEPKEKEPEFEQTEEGEVIGYVSWKDGDLHLEPATPNVNQPTQQKPQFKTAEEILDKYGIFDYNYASKSLVIRVMEEYFNVKMRDEAMADAHLIHAAPDLLEALQGLLTICEPFITEHHYYHKKAHQAINKALGL